MSAHRTTAIALAILLVMALTSCSASVRDTPATAAATPGAQASASCGTAAPEVLAKTAGVVARRIYAGEAASSETHADQREVEGYAPLLSAVANGEAAAVKAAVTSLVYSGTHIVRLRVLKGTTLLADVGGAYILAPVSGTLDLHGRAIGSYVLSVQDDLGYVKLETRYVGAPLILRSGPRQIPVEGQLTPGPASIPQHGPVTYRNVTYQAFSFNASAYPSGPLRISLLLPLPGGLSTKSCAEIKSAELGVVAQRISRRFTLSPSDFSTYVGLVHILTGGLTYIRSSSHQLAGSTRPGPSRLPSAGTVRYHGTTYQVASFQAPSSVGMVTVYELTTG
jgi:hypothetical protein